MVEFEKLLAQPKLVTVQGVEFNVYPLAFKDLKAVTNAKDRDGFDVMVRGCLKKSFPNATDEQLDLLKLDFVSEFMLEVYKVSELEIDVKKLQQMTA